MNSEISVSSVIQPNLKNCFIMKKAFLFSFLSLFISACDPGHTIDWVVRNASQSKAVVTTKVYPSGQKTDILDAGESLILWSDGGLGYATDRFASDTSIIGESIISITKDTVLCKKDWNDGKNWQFEGKKSDGDGVFSFDDDDFE